MREVIGNILKQAVFAASGDNSQPWRFEVEGNKIFIFNLPDKDNPVLNFEQSGSYIAHGGLIENIVIISKSYGYDTRIELFPSEKPDLVSSITLEPAKSEKDELLEAIPSRCTNRRPYKKINFSDAQKECLLSVSEAISMPRKGRIIFLESEADKKSVASAGSLIEQVILEDKELHRLMFKDVLWSAKENQQKVSGLYIKTMEFAPPVKFVFWLASSWPIISKLNKIGLAKFVASQDAKLYQTGAAMGAIAMEAGSREDFVCAGRILQRMWLEATKLKLSLQPVSAMLFAGRRVEKGDKSPFCQKHLEIIKKNFAILEERFKIKQGEVLAMMFRVGFADPPSARTCRFGPNIVWK